MQTVARLDSELLSLERKLRVDQLDGKPGLSQQEALALGYVHEQFGDPLVYGEYDWGLSTYMTNRLGAYYQGLMSTKPRKQTVYIDFSPFEKYYLDNLQDRKRMTFAKWQGEFLQKLQDCFVTEDGPLNIDFVTRNPGVPCIHMVFSPDLVSQAVAKRPDDEKLIFMKYFRKMFPSLLEGELELIRKKSGSDSLSDDQLLLQAVTSKAVSDKDQDFRASGITFNPVSLDAEFGNQYDESFIVMQGIHSANMDIEITALVAAHEIGHALGVQHPMSALRRFNGPQSETEDLRDYGHIMTQYDRRLGIKRFNDYTIDYFRYILGVKSK